MDLPALDLCPGELLHAAPRVRSRRRVTRGTPYDRPSSRQACRVQTERSVQSPVAFIQNLFPNARGQNKQQQQPRTLPVADQQQASNLVLPETSEVLGMELGWPVSFAQHYDLGACIGTGAFGTVHLATARASNQQVAVKILAKSRAKQAREKTLAKVNREATLLAGVQQCTGIARFLGKYEDQDFAYMVLELCQGGDLEQLLEVRAHEQCGACSRVH